MIEKITDHNLERYDSRLKEWCDRKFFEKGNYGKYETTEESSTAAFYPVPDTPLEGKVKFSFKETPPANGDKGPTNPSTIAGVSSVRVTRCGKNLVPQRDGETTSNGITFSPQPDGGYRIHGETDGSHNAYRSLNGGFYWQYKNNVTYCVNLFSATTNSKIGLQAYNSGGSIRMSVTANSGGATYLNSVGDELLQTRIYVDRTAGEVDLIVYPQIELGSTATAFEPYDGTDYTLPLGSTYYGGTVNFATGVMTVTWGKRVFDGTENIFVSNDIYRNNTNSGIYIGTSNISSVFSGDIASVVNSIACDMFEVVTESNFTSGAESVYKQVGGSLMFRIDNSRLAPYGYVYGTSTSSDCVTYFKNWLANNPVAIYYNIATPFTVQLTPTQILSLSQIDKYTPRLNTVYTDADSIQISYLKSPIRDEYEKTQAILSLGGNS